MNRVNRYVLLALVSLTGCSRPPADVASAGPPVSGRVVVRGMPPDVQSPLEGSRVRFESVADPKVTGIGLIGPEGDFQAATVAANGIAPGLRPGEYRARIEPPRDGIRPVVAAKYLNAKTSGLTVTVPSSDKILLVVDRATARSVD